MCQPQDYCEGHYGNIRQGPSRQALNLGVEMSPHAEPAQLLGACRTAPTYAWRWRYILSAISQVKSQMMSASPTRPKMRPAAWLSGPKAADRLKARTASQRCAKAEPKKASEVTVPRTLNVRGCHADRHGANHCSYTISTVSAHSMSRRSRSISDRDLTTANGDHASAPFGDYCDYRVPACNAEVRVGSGTLGFVRGRISMGHVTARSSTAPAKRRCRRSRPSRPVGARHRSCATSCPRVRAEGARASRCR
jgi:hypothetical protein